jgi:hypothetical protein
MNMTTRTRSTHGASFRKAGWLAAGAMLAVAALAPSTVGAATVWATVTGHAAASAESNNPSFWGEDCTKIDAVDGNLGDAYVLENSFDLVIVKAGTGDFANTLFAGASAGESVWADTNGDSVPNPGGQNGDKQISHIVFCGPAETTTTTTETTATTTEVSETTTETTETTTETSDTTTETTDETTTETTDTTTSFTGEELPAVGTPGVTPPPTDTLSAVAPASTNDGFRMLLAGFAALLGVALFLLPKEAAKKR